MTTLFQLMICLSLGLGVSSPAMGQDAQFQIMFSNILHDFGAVEAWDNAPAIFYITNTGEKPLDLQPSAHLAKDLRVEMPAEPIPAGKTIEAKVYFSPADVGPFQKKVLFDLGDMDEPIDLYIKGEVLGFHRSENELPRDTYAANNLVLLIDISSSMKLPYKLPLLKESIKKLVGSMRDIDYLTVISYSSITETVVPQTRIANRENIYKAIDSLEASGRSRGAGALSQSYLTLENNFLQGANNQLILATDGIFNDSEFPNKELFKIIASKAEKDMVMSVIGFGSSDEANKFMRKMAKSGEGSYYQIERNGDVRDVLLEEIKERSLIK